MKQLEDTEFFHAKMGFWPYCDDTVVAFEEVAEKRIRLLKEECAELCEAIEGGNKKEILHELCDLIYVTLGVAVEEKIEAPQIEAAWAMVHAANMEKKRPDHPLGKAEKPEGWEKANVIEAFDAKLPMNRYFVSFVKGGEISNAIWDIAGPMTRMALLNVSDGTGGSTIMNYQKLG